MKTNHAYTMELGIDWAAVARFLLFTLPAAMGGSYLCLAVEPKASAKREPKDNYKAFSISMVAAMLGSYLIALSGKDLTTVTWWAAGIALVGTKGVTLAQKFLLKNGQDKLQS